MAVLDENRRPVAGAYRYADVVRDGMVVDYIGAIRLVREMKEELEEKLEQNLFTQLRRISGYRWTGRWRHKKCCAGCRL